MLRKMGHNKDAIHFEGICDNLMELVACNIYKWLEMLMKTLSNREQYKYLLRGDSMNVGNTFWPNLAMKTRFFTHVLHRSPRNSYMLSEFRLVFKKQIIEYCVGFSMIFF